VTVRYGHRAEEHKTGATGKFERYKAAEALRFAVKSQQVPTVSTTLGRVE